MLFAPGGTRPLKPSSLTIRLLSGFPMLRSSGSRFLPHLWAASSRSFSAASIADPSSKLQVYSSLSTDPYINLSIEHHLLTHSSPDSRILLLYTNSSSVIIGRNQNPWLEVNLPLLARIRDDTSFGNWHDEPVALVRRRSGGGAVFHDSGNVNFSVICPPSEFDRDKHGLMVVRALSALGRSNTRVNERHDIVMDLPPAPGDSGKAAVRKISGSAYKLTRLRALHHGTCLLQSQNLGQISHILRSPAAPFITALGSPSVRSPVANVDIEPAAFKDAVVAEFVRMYGKPNVHLQIDVDFQGSGSSNRLPWHEVSKSVDELRSKEWIYGQTPRFSFNSTEARSSVDASLLPPSPQSKIFFETRHGKIENFELDGIKIPIADAQSEGQIYRNLWECHDWPRELSKHGSQQDTTALGSWLHQVLGFDFSGR